MKHSKYTPPDGFPRTLRAQRVFLQFSINFRISSKAKLSKAVFAGAQRGPLLAAFAIIELPLPNMEFTKIAFKLLFLIKLKCLLYDIMYNDVIIKMQYIF